MQKIKLYTIHPVVVLETLERETCLRGKASLADEDFFDAYHWLMLQMSKRIPDYRGGTPLFAWVEKPPFNEYREYVPAGGLGVCLEINIPRERILLSDFHLWHCVLNNWHLGLTNKEEERWERNRSTKQHRQAMKKSWDRIFDLSLTSSSQGFGVKNPVQATFEYFRFNEVVSVEYFIGGCI
jgi:hypothetical protein